MCEIAKDYPNELQYADWLWVGIWTHIYSQTNDVLLAYQMAYRGLENFYRTLKGERNDERYLL
ncbi:MAG: hypothetical protein ACTSQG_09110 [Promethearchaeota archaeon]